MRIKVNFGLIDSREVDWWRPAADFPKLIKFLGRNYEWVIYQHDPTNRVDFIYTFSELPSYDPNYNVDCTTWSDLFSNESNACECGARFSEFPWDHMRMCKLWKPWNKL